MGLVIGDVHLSELERLEERFVTVRIERPIIRSSVQDSNPSATSPPNATLPLSLYHDTVVYFYTVVFFTM